jgi:hypothetical protein
MSCPCITSSFTTSWTTTRSGAFANPVDGTVLLFKGATPAAAETFAKADPYVTNGLVTKWRVREWTTVIGKDAEVPLPPGM